jgi:hypothetical protein
LTWIEVNGESTSGQEGALVDSLLMTRFGRDTTSQIPGGQRVLRYIRVDNYSGSDSEGEIGVWSVVDIYVR